MSITKNFLCPKDDGNGSRISSPFWAKSHEELKYFNSDASAHGHSQIFGSCHTSRPLPRHLLLWSAKSTRFGLAYAWRLKPSSDSRRCPCTPFLWCTRLWLGLGISDMAWRMPYYIVDRLWEWTGQPSSSVSSFLLPFGLNPCLHVLSDRVYPGQLVTDFED